MPWKTLASRYSMAVGRCIKGPCSNSGWRVQSALKLIQRVTRRLVQRRHLGRQTALQMIQQQWTGTAALTRVVPGSGIGGRQSALKRRARTQRIYSSINRSSIQHTFFSRFRGYSLQARILPFTPPSSILGRTFVLRAYVSALNLWHASLPDQGRAKHMQYVVVHEQMELVEVNERCRKAH